MLETLPPSGVFTPSTLDGDFLLFAGGSGITPVFSILRSVLANGSGRIWLIYANRDEQSVIFRDELNALSGAHPTRLQVIHWLDSVQGVPSVAQLAELADITGSRSGLHLRPRRRSWTPQLLRCRRWKWRPSRSMLNALFRCPMRKMPWQPMLFCN